MAQTLIITATQAMTAPLPGTPKLRIPGDNLVITSDTFTGANVSTFTGRKSDARLGGDSLPYELLTDDAWGISNGRLVPGGAPRSSAALLPLPADRSKDVRASVKIAALTSSTSSTPASYLIVRRSIVASPQSQVRVGFTNTAAALYYAIAGVQTYVSGSAMPVAVGDTVEVREYDGLVEMYKNGSAFISAKLPAGTFSGDYAGFASGAETGWAFDDFKVTETIH